MLIKGSKIVVLSDIHANLSALKAVIEDVFITGVPDAFVLLGDIVNYGMRPNETISFLEQLSNRLPIICAIRGNHDDAMLSPELHLSHFSTERGRNTLLIMSQMITDESIRFIKAKLSPKGIQDIEFGGKRILCVHGDIDNPLWGKMNEINDERYSCYDYVLSGHSHVPHLREIFFDVNHPDYRNKHKTVFINPGSVGQPRNHNPRAQYAYLDVESGIVHFNSVSYDITLEMNLYGETIDEFYRTRLKNGI